MIALVPGGSFPGGLHLPELRQDDAEGLRARHQRHHQPRRRHVRELLVSRPTPTANFALSRAEPAGEEPLQRRASTSTQAGSSATSNVSYSDSAFWQDVLDDRYHGTTEAYTLRERRLRREVGERTAHDVGQGDEPGEPGRSSSTSSATSSSAGRSIGEFARQFLAITASGRLGEPPYWRTSRHVRGS